MNAIPMRGRCMRCDNCLEMERIQTALFAELKDFFQSHVSLPDGWADRWNAELVRFRCLQPSEKCPTSGYPEEISP